MLSLFFLNAQHLSVYAVICTVVEGKQLQFCLVSKSTATTSKSVSDTFNRDRVIKLQFSYSYTGA